MIFIYKEGYFITNQFNRKTYRYITVINFHQTTYMGIQDGFPSSQLRSSFIKKDILLLINSTEKRIGI
jgi:hypothetical protein